METTRFSIIVPVYNVGEYLPQCIESVVAQTCRDWEMILVNDGSTDDSLDICNKYLTSNNNIRVINKENGGLVSARKAGALEARGEYIVCLDGDDWIETDTLSTIEEVIYKYNGIDVVCYGIVSVSGDSKKYSPFVNRPGFYSRAQIIDEVFPMLIENKDASYFAPSLCGKAIKRELYIENQMKVDDRIVVGEDGACTVPVVINSNSLYIIEKYMYCYRNNINSISKKKKPLPWEGSERILEHFRKFTEKEEYDFSDQISRRVVHDLFRVSITRFYGGKSYWETRKDICKHLDGSRVRESVHNSHFSMKPKPKLMEVAIKKKLVLLMYCYSRIK